MNKIQLENSIISLWGKIFSLIITRNFIDYNSYEFERTVR
jgi:hypothetical protein